MGGAVSAGVNNDDLVDNLLEADYITTPSVERVFRAVDRGMYFTKEDRETAYKDLAWKSGNFHLSAPCIYCVVMENLQLAPGLSFLNLGSGTGYLSTMAGLILGSFGINHGVEIHQNVVQYAYQKLEEFKKTAPAMDEYDFCEPKFVEGNCLRLSSSSPQYDRVYCGASCPSSYESYMKNLIKVGGILVIPLNDQLLKITRTSESTWEKKSMLAVSFANLIPPSSASSQSVVLPDAEPISLMDACRTTIRSVLHDAVEHEHPNLKNRAPPKSKNKKQTIQRLFLPLFGESDSIDIIRNEGTDDDSDDHSSRRDRIRPDNVVNDERPRIARVVQVQGHRFPVRLRFLNSPSNPFDEEDDLENHDDTPVSMAGPSQDIESSTSSASRDDSSDNSMDVDESEGTHESPKLSAKKPKIKWTQSTSGKKERSKRKEAEMNESESSQSSCRVLRSSSASGLHADNDAASHTSEESLDSSEGNSSLPCRKKKAAKREKVDSGIGDDDSHWLIASDMASDMELADTDSDDESSLFLYTSVGREVSLRPGQGPLNRQAGLYLRGKEQSRTDENESTKSETEQLYVNSYVVFMRSKIQQLPVPPSVKSYINYYRDL